MSERRHIRAVVSGRVQGVWFRSTAREEALRLGLVGFVRNLHNGRLEIEAQGPTAQIDQLLTWCKVGPDAAMVLSVQIDELEHDDELRGFEIS